jgi:hypothetical protein
MTRTGRVDARNYGDSPVTRVYVPIASPVFESCSLMLAAQKVACTINLRHNFEAPLRVDCGVLATPSQARARDLAPTLCRALMVQAASCYFSASRAAFAADSLMEQRLRAMFVWAGLPAAAMNFIHRQDQLG